MALLDTEDASGNILIAVMYFVKAVWSHLQADLYAVFDSQQVARGQKKMLNEEAQRSYLLLCYLWETLAFSAQHSYLRETLAFHARGVCFG